MVTVKGIIIVLCRKMRWPGVILLGLILTPILVILIFFYSIACWLYAFLPPKIKDKIPSLDDVIETILDDKYTPNKILWIDIDGMREQTGCEKSKRSER